MNRTRPYLVLTLLLLAGAVALRPRRSTRAAQGTPTAPSAPDPGVPPVLGPEVCIDAGYLCAGLAGREEPRVLRWADGTPSVRIVIPPPPGLEPGRADRLQRAAARGVRAWQNQPLPLRIETSDGTLAADIRVTWRERLAGSELGHVESHWIRRGDSASVEIIQFLLATHHPLTGAALSPDDIALAAAHEMGHALGLPHSDSPRDVMYPTNTAERLSVQDYRTMEALYALPNGARIQLPGPGS